MTVDTERIDLLPVRRAAAGGGPGPRLSARAIASALGNPPPTAEQQAVVEAPLEPLLVVAGAGSGKTETMASRVVWLVANGFVEPDQVLGLTFTRKAATELGERIARRLRRLRHEGLWEPRPEEDGAEVLGGTPTVSTYHAYAGRLVGEHALRLGVEPDSRLLSEAAAWQYAAEVVERYDGPMGDVDYAASTVTAAVVALAGEMAEHLLEPEQVDRLLADVVDRVQSLPPGGRARGVPTEVKDLLRSIKARRQVLPLVRAYLDLKRARDALDFADQLALAARLARDIPVIGAMERQRFRAVLLDEFQDTSEAQMVLLRSLFAGSAGLPVTAVGDPHQSIYGWRGASATTLSRFPRLFGRPDQPTRVLPLSTSWRNDEAILAAANLTAGPLRRGAAVDAEVLRPRPDAGPGSVRAARLETVEQEAAHVAEWVAGHWLGPRGGHTGVSAAVLCRKRSQFAPVMEALKGHGLPIEVVGLGGLLTTPEVADIVSLLWVVQDPSRGDHLMRLLTGPAHRLGPADLDGLATWARALQRRQQARADAARDQEPETVDTPSIVEALDELPPAGWRGPEGQSLSDSARHRLRSLAEVVRRLRGLTGLSLADLAGEAERALGLDIEVLARPEYTPASARAQLDAFADVAATFSGSADRPTLGGFLSWLAAAQQEERGLDKGYLEVSVDAVQVLTVHAAKGLEWDVVAVPGLTEATFPAHGGATTTWAKDHWRHPEPKDKGWCGGLDGVPYPLRGDADGLPVFRWQAPGDLVGVKHELESFQLDGGRHAVAEERRLAYVAFTRARHHLLLTAPVWADASTPRLTSRFLTELVRDARAEVGPWCELPVPGEDGKAVNPRQAEPLTAAWPGPEPREGRRVQLVEAQEAVLDALRRARTGASREWQEPAGQAMLPLPGSVSARDEEIEILLRERRRGREGHRPEVRLPRHLSASAVVSLAEDRERFAEQLRRPMPAPPAVAARRGTAFHAWVEQHYARAAMVDLLELPGSADEDAGDEDLEVLKATFLASPWAHRRPAAVEVAVETVVTGVALRGRIDAVFPRRDGGFTIVDWKTGAEPSGAAARVRAIQLGAYVVAFTRLRGLAPGQVDAAFYYAASGETVWPTLPDEAELEALLSEAVTDDVDGAAVAIGVGGTR